MTALIMTIILTEISMTTAKPHESRWKVFKGHLVLVFILLPRSHCGGGDGAWKEGCAISLTGTPEITLYTTEVCQAYMGCGGGSVSISNTACLKNSSFSSPTHLHPKGYTTGDTPSAGQEILTQTFAAQLL